MNLNKKRYYSIITISIILIFIVYPIRLTHSIKITGKIYPGEEWLLIRNQNDVLTTSHINNLNGGLNQNKIYSFERGDIASINIDPALSVGSLVHVGDTIATLVSNESQLLKVSLFGELAIAEKNLKVYQSAEIIPIVDEAQQMYDKAVVIYQSQRNIYERSLDLHKNNLISDEEFEIQKSIFYVSEADVNIAKSHLESVSIGSKPEIIQLQKQLISNLKEQSQLVMDRIDGLISLAPFNGIVTYTNSIDTLILIQSANNFVTTFPIPFKYVNLLQNEQEIGLSIPNIGNMLGYITTMDNNINIIHGKPVILITVAIDNNSLNLTPGQNIIGKVNLGKQTIFNIIFDFLN